MLDTSTRLIFKGKAGAYPSGAPASCGTHSKLQALSANIGLGFKWLKAKNALAYYEAEIIRTVKSLTDPAQGWSSGTEGYLMRPIRLHLDLDDLKGVDDDGLGDAGGKAG